MSVILGTTPESSTIDADVATSPAPTAIVGGVLNPSVGTIDLVPVTNIIGQANGSPTLTAAPDSVLTAIVGTGNQPGIGAVPQDASGIIVPGVSAPGAGGGLTAEQVQDLVAAMLVEGTGVNLTYNDGTGTLTITSTATGGGASNVTATFVTTGTEARDDDFAVNLWIDLRGSGATRPDNVGDNDLWFTPNGATGGGDTEAPSVPTGMAATDIQATEITVGWSASTDNVAVTGYQVRIDGGAPVSESTLSHTFTGLTADTEYSFEVRARDAAGNWSAWSSVVPVSTDPEVTIPSPAVRYNFNEGTGTTATSVADGHTLTDQTGSPVWGSGTIQTEMRGYLTGMSTGTYSDWTVAIDVVFSGEPGGEKSLFVHGASLFLNFLVDGKIKWYGASTVTADTGIAFAGTKRVVVAQSATTLKIYVDGVEFVSSTQANAYDLENQSNVFYTGGFPNAEVDSLRFWNSALDATQVAALGA